MAHFAEVNEDNVVVRVLVTNDNELNGDEGHLWLVNTYGGTWIKTSYNGNIRKNFAGPGFSYSPELDAFIPPKPYDSWVLDEDSANWQAPTPYPSDGFAYIWDESTVKWQVAEFQEPTE